MTSRYKGKNDKCVYQSAGLESVLTFIVPDQPPLLTGKSNSKGRTGRRRLYPVQQSAGRESGNSDVTPTQNKPA